MIFPFVLFNKLPYNGKEERVKGLGIIYYAIARITCINEWKENAFRFC